MTMSTIVSMSTTTTTIMITSTITTMSTITSIIMTTMAAAVTIIMIMQDIITRMKCLRAGDVRRSILIRRSRSLIS